MAANFPTTLDSYSDLTCNSTDNPKDIVNNIQDAVEALEAKVGVNSSAVTTSIDYLLKSTSSSNPGHKHTLANGATDVSATASEVDYNAGITPGSASASKTVVVDSNKDFNFGTGDVTATIVNATSINSNFPQGFLINGRINRVVTSNDLIVSIVTLAGTDPSATDPVYIRIGNTVRSITSALSKTLADGTNWFNQGAADLAAKDLDIFVYLIYNTTTTPGVLLGLSRNPGFRVFGDSTNTSTSSRYLAFSGSNTPGVTDEVEVIGRINATLSASNTSHLWTVPATSIILNYPIHETRWFAYTPTISLIGAGTAPTYTGGGTTGRAKILRGESYVDLTMQNSAGGTAGSGAGVVAYSLPMEALSIAVGEAPVGPGQYYNNAAGEIGVTHIATTLLGRVVRSTTAFVTGADQNNATRFFIASAKYPS